MSATLDDMHPSELLQDYLDDQFIKYCHQELSKLTTESKLIIKAYIEFYCFWCVEQTIENFNNDIYIESFKKWQYVKYFNVKIINITINNFYKSLK